MSSTILLPHAHSFVLGTAVINNNNKEEAPKNLVGFEFSREVFVGNLVWRIKK
jgi:hypothetical protein